jgi:hypothetical protein
MFCDAHLIIYYDMLILRNINIKYYYYYYYYKAK